MSIPFWPIMGGIFIGLSAVLLMALIGRIAGVSGILWGAIVDASANDKLWRILFVGGIMLGAFLFHLLSGTPYPTINNNIPLSIIAGLLVGIGVKLGSGCTSGHGVCGISRFSMRSLVATLTFMSAGVLTVLIVKSL
jgi:uncharacterized membrane protein YedE/YeeE